MPFASYSRYGERPNRWLPEFPKHWSIGPAKSFFVEINDRSADGGEELLSVSEYFGVKPRKLAFSQDEHLSRAESLEGYKKCQPGDLVMNIMLAWKTGLGVSEYAGIVSPAYSVFRCGARCWPRFYHYLLRTAEYTAYFKSYSSGVIDSRLRLYPESFGRLAVPNPPIEEQRAIARFLDYETARIDTLIAKQEQLIELLKEKRQAVISHAVTKGLNPDAPMKDSGVEWLGKVPAHWEVSNYKYIARPGTTITYGIVQAGPHTEGGVPYIRTSDMSGEELPDSGYLRTAPEIDRAYARSRVFEGDIVVAIRATVGKALPVPSHLEGANLTQGTAKISPGQGLLSGYLLHWAQSTACLAFLNHHAKGATFKEITLEVLRNTPICVPPIDEQQEIVADLSGRLSMFASLQTKAERAMGLLRERRTALISAAVTGKIDVRNWQPPDEQAA